MSNPFFETWQTPFNMPPFETIQDHHFEAAFEQGFSEHWAEIEAIANNPAPVNHNFLCESREPSPIMAKAVTVHTIVILV